MQGQGRQTINLYKFKFSPTLTNHPTWPQRQVLTISTKKPSEIYCSIYQHSSQMQLFKFLKLKSSLWAALSTWQLRNSALPLVATILDSADREHFHHCRQFYWTALSWKKDQWHFEHRLAFVKTRKSLWVYRMDRSGGELGIRMRSKQIAGKGYKIQVLIGRHGGLKNQTGQEFLNNFKS